MPSGQLVDLQSQNFYEESRYALLYLSSILTYPCRLQVATLENPLESGVATIAVLGSKMLGLTEDGGHLLIWDMTTSGEPSQL